jgi:IrrE N-terminal-like domain
MASSRDHVRRGLQDLVRFVESGAYRVVQPHSPDFSPGKLLGETQYDKGTVIVRVRRPLERRMRVLAHEAGHVFLHGLTGRRNHLWQLQLELEAEIFCREALEMFDAAGLWEIEGQSFIDHLRDHSHIYAQSDDAVQRAINHESAFGQVFTNGTLPPIADLAGDLKSVLNDAIERLAEIRAQRP